ncbi:MAG: ornithine cyclodeaminase family protein [Albidovulum sp.]
MKDQNGFVYLSDAVLSGLGIGAADVIACIEKAVLAKSNNVLWTAPKAAFMPGDGRYMMATLAAADDPQIISVKSVIVSPRNPERGMSGINGAIMLLDSETGELKAVMDANWVTAIRTAGLSAVVARRLANPNSKSIAFIGCGVQAHSHLEAFSQLFPITELRAVGRGQAKVDQFCDTARSMGLAATACASAQEAMDGADLIVSSITLSYDVDPFLDARWLKPGAFAAITDLALPWIPAGMGAFETVIIDDLEQEKSSPKPMIDSALVCGDLTDLVTGKIASTFSPDQRAAFVFRGIAIGDFALAALAYERAMAVGKGTRVS